jgi:NAD(P)-dependent dehydrogenase (short-subunit alcohol dehydrogenase family)
MLLLPLLAPALIRARGKLAVISSSMGSISRATSNAGWLYRASKAALNAVLKSASLELGPRGVVCMAFDPGWVRTDMGGPRATLEVTDSVAGMRRVVDAANDSFNGKFLKYTGEQLAW